MESSQQPWFALRGFQVVSALAVIVGLAVIAYVGICRRDNDFLYHRSYGECFLNGQTRGYQHYPIGRGMINALTVGLPYRVDRAVHFGTAILALALALYWWNALAALRRPIPGPLLFASLIFTLALATPYLVRDLQDCGLQLLLLFFLTAAAWALKNGSSIGCGFWLGLAATYKVTPLIFFPFLLWKRQWRAAGWMAVFAVALNLAPAFYLGWDGMLAGNRRWLEFVGHCLAAPNPSETPVEPPNHRNQGLTIAVARFLQTYPPGHPLALNHAAFVQFGNLDAGSAKQGVRLVLLVLAGCLLWRWRKPWSVGPARQAGLRHRLSAPDLANEWAAVTLLGALVSPLCWLQHLVLIIPALFLWLRACLAGAPIPRWQRFALGAIAVAVLLVHRDFMGNALYDVLMSYKLHTLASLAALVLVLNQESGALSPEPAC